MTSVDLHMGELSKEKVPSGFRRKQADGVAGKRRVQVSQTAVSSWFYDVLCFIYNAQLIDFIYLHFLVCFSVGELY